MKCLLRLLFLSPQIIINIGVVLAGFTDQQPAAPQSNDISGTVNGCANAILENDDDGDGAIRRGEFLDFVNTLADLLCLPPRPSLDLELQSVFVSIACLCQEREGNEIDCCFGESAGLFVDGAESSTVVSTKRSEEDESYLQAACLLTQAVLGPEQCDPEMSNNNTSGVDLDGGAIVDPEPEPVAFPCTNEDCANNNSDEGYHFCGVDGNCHPYSCHNFYRFFDPALTGYSNEDGTYTTLSFECFGYTQGAMENAHGVTYGCDPQFPSTLASHDNVVKPFNRKCTADQGGDSIFECYEFILSETDTDFSFFLRESESSFPDCADGKTPKYYSLVSSTNHYEGFEGLQGNPIVAAGGDLDGDTIWQGQEGSTFFDRDIAMTAMYANVLLPRQPQSETNNQIQAGSLGNNPLREPSAQSDTSNIFDHGGPSNAGTDIDWTAFFETLRECGLDCATDKILAMVAAQYESDISATATTKQTGVINFTPTLSDTCSAIEDTIELMITLEFCTVASTPEGVQHDNTNDNTMNDTISIDSVTSSTSNATETLVHDIQFAVLLSNEQGLDVDVLKNPNHQRNLTMILETFLQKVVSRVNAATRAVAELDLGSNETGTFSLVEQRQPSSSSAVKESNFTLLPGSINIVRIQESSCIDEKEVLPKTTESLSSSACFHVLAECTVYRLPQNGTLAVISESSVQELFGNETKRSLNDGLLYDSREEIAPDWSFLVPDQSNIELPLVATMAPTTISTSVAPQTSATASSDSTRSSRPLGWLTVAFISLGLPLGTV